MKKAKTVKIPKVNDDEILIVKVGSDDRPAGVGDIRAVQISLAQLKQNDSLTLVTHHLMEFVVLKKKFFKGKICVLKHDEKILDKIRR